MFMYLFFYYFVPMFLCSGLYGVSDLKYRSNDSTAMWVSSLGNHPGMAFLYELSLLNGTTLNKSQVTEPQLHLPGLEDTKSYILDVWEQCDGLWESERSQLCIEGANSSLSMFLRAVGPLLHQRQCNFDYWWSSNRPEQLVI